MSFSFFLCAYSVLRLSLHTLPPGSAEEGCSFLVDDRRIPEREREKNSSDLSRSYHAAITDVKKREAPGSGTEAGREAGVPHDALNCTSDGGKDAGRVGFLVLERMVQGEEPA